MRRHNSRLQMVGWILFALLLVSVTFAVAFYLTAILYRITGFNPPAILSQLINSILGLFILSAMMRLLSRFFRDRQVDVFLPIIQALERISRGDFSIRLDNDLGNNQIVGELAKSVNKMALELGQMENMRQEFISNVSHEIQSPLTSIQGFAQALKNERISPQDRLHYLEIIEMESKRLSRVSDDLLKLASLDSDQVVFEPRLYRLDKQIRSLVLTCEPQWSDKKINMDVSLQEVSINADEDLLSQVWLNLIHNSIKFTPPGGRIKVSLVSSGDSLEFNISDSGIGISAEDQVHIFERFFKADKSRTRSNGGSGLGLSIAKKVVEIHRGSIRVESRPGAGATFIVSLPA